MSYIKELEINLVSKLVQGKFTLFIAESKGIT